MVADSTKDSRLFRGSPISRDVFKKRKAGLLMKLRHCRVDDSRRSQRKRENVVEEEEEAFVDVSDDSSDDDYSDGFNMFKEEDPSESDNKPTSTTANPEEPSPDQKKEDVRCPLCDEEMDATDLVFKPCSSCEFKMCLFCYKKINEGAGVCPGCRKKYEKDQTSGNSGEVSFQQRGGEAILPLSSSFQVLGSDSD